MDAQLRVRTLASSSPGVLCNPDFFRYGVEAYEACKKRSLTSDIIDEQKKVQEADLVIFQVRFSSNYYGELDSFYVRLFPHAEFHAPRSGISVFSTFAHIFVSGWVRRSMYPISLLQSPDPSAFALAQQSMECLTHALSCPPSPPVPTPDVQGLHENQICPCEYLPR